MRKGWPAGEVWLARNAVGTPRAVKIVLRHEFEDERPYQREFDGLTRFSPKSSAVPFSSESWIYV